MILPFQLHHLLFKPTYQPIQGILLLSIYRFQITNLLPVFLPQMIHFIDQMSDLLIFQIQLTHQNLHLRVLTRNRGMQIVNLASSLLFNMPHRSSIVFQINVFHRL